MGEDYRKQLRRVDRMRNREADIKAFEEKVRKCYNPVKRFVEKEIEKGKMPIIAIDEILNNASLERTYPELRTNEVKRTVRNILLNTYLKKAEMEKEIKGEER